MSFLGKKIIWMLSVGVITGVCLFLIEYAFAQGLQAFLVGIEAMPPTVARIPAWVPHRNLVVTLIFFLVIGTIRGLLYWFQSFIQGSVFEEFKFRSRSRLVQWAFHSESASSGQIMTFFHEYCNTAGQAICNLQTLIVQMTSVIFFVIALGLMAPTLTVISCSAICLLGIVIVFIDRKICSMGEALSQAGKRINDRLLMSIKNLLLMKIYGTQNQEEKTVQEDLQTYRRIMVFYQALSGFKLASPQMLGIVLVCLVALTAGSWFQMEAAFLISYFYLFLRFLQGFAQLAQTSSGVFINLPQLKILARWWKESALIPQQQYQVLVQPRTTPLKPISWKVQNLHFQFPDSSEPILEALSFDIPPESFFTITGHSGVGKSTLLNLLIGQLLPTKGSINIALDGSDLKSVPEVLSILHPNLGYVGPESFLIEGTLYDNLTYGLSVKPTSQELRQALNRAECQFIYDHPAGLNHILTEQGQGLSAGQKQRISLARALLRKPRALILDEATANLDSDTEENLLSTLSKLRSDMTVIAVTHRSAFIRFATKHLHLGKSNSLAMRFDA